MRTGVKTLERVPPCGRAREFRNAKRNQRLHSHYHSFIHSFCQFHSSVSFHIEKARVVAKKPVSGIPSLLVG